MGGADATEGEGRPFDRPGRLAGVGSGLLLDRWVLAAVVVQLVGYAALSALVAHSEFAAVVDPLRRLPPALLVPVALLAVPAVALAVALGAVLSAVGVAPTPVLVVVGAYVVAVAVVWLSRRGAASDAV